jgi:hypothetical protein
VFTHVQLALLFSLESILTHFYLPNQFSLLIPITILCIFAVIHVLRKNKRARASGYYDFKKVGHLILSILFLGAIVTLIIPEQFAIGSYQRSLRTTDISFIFIPLSLLGFGMSIKRFSLSKIVLLFSILTTSVTIITGMNNAFPQFRLVIYFLILVVYGAIKGVQFFYEEIKRVFKNNIPIAIYLAILLICLSFFGYNVLSQTNYKTYYIQEDIHSTQIFLNQLHESERIIPQKHSIDKVPYILRYLKVDERQIIDDEELYYISDFSEFISLISFNYSGVNRVFVYVIERKSSNPTYYTPSIEMLEKNTEKQQIGTITIYTIDI